MGTRLRSGMEARPYEVRDMSIIILIRSNPSKSVFDYPTKSFKKRYTVMQFTILTTILFILALTPLVLAGSGKIKTAPGKKRALITNVCAVVFIFALMFALALAAYAAEEPASAGDTSSDVSAGVSVGTGLGLIAAALAVGLSGLGGGIAVASSASAAIGAISENPAVFVQALIFVALAEGVALYGLLIAFQILAKL